MASYVAGFNLTESEGFLYDASVGTAPKTLAQQAVDQAKGLGANHVILNVRAIMKGPYSSEVIPVTAPAERSKEAVRMARLIGHIQSQGMTVGLRPIFLWWDRTGSFLILKNNLMVRSKHGGTAIFNRKIPIVGLNLSAFTWKSTSQSQN